jgi:ParB/RepB/Spo0J family partition protein
MTAAAAEQDKADKVAAPIYGNMVELAGESTLKNVSIDDIEPVHVEPDAQFIKSIAASNGAQVPIVLMSGAGKRYRIIDGIRRVAAHRTLELKTIAARLYDANAFTPKDRAIALVRLNHHRSVNPIAEYNALDTLRKAGMTDSKDIAQAVGLNIRQVQRILRLDKLQPELRTLLADGRMTFDTAIKAAALPAKEQKKLAKMAADGGEDEAGRVTLDAVHSLREKGPAHNMALLIGDSLAPTMATLIGQAIASLERAAALTDGDNTKAIHGAIKILKGVN